jgi:surface polysaccharide O-acyltransferase-like enzyme
VLNSFAKNILINSRFIYVSFYFRMLIAFLMIPVLQKQLDSFKDTVWNCHRIRTQIETLLPDKVPNHMYDFPEEYGLEKCGKE